MMIMIVMLVMIHAVVKSVDSFMDMSSFSINKALMTCPILFHLSLANTTIQHDYLFIKRLLEEPEIAVSSFLHFSNHLIISLDIIFLFSMIMLVLYQTLKLTKILSVK